jgi:FkbM family methyltransferase
MNKSRRKAEEALWITGLHGTALRLYRRTTGRMRTRLQRSMTSFYGTLLPPAALVFDIGANVGLFSGVFSSLGASVVAVEPNPDCIRHIELSYASAKISTIQAIAGPRNGLATINVSDKRDDLSSVSVEWIAAVQREHGDYKALWSRLLTVPMVTLDTLVDHYGLPNFIKIDVEGFEEGVLDGLSNPPALLSFEFNSLYLDATFRCLDKGLFNIGSTFNFAIGDPVRFELGNWVGREQLKKALNTMKGRERYGDVFVKRSEYN